MTYTSQKETELLQERFSLKLTAYLSAGAADLPYDISERLRAGRVQAVAQRKIAKPVIASSLLNNGGSATLSMGADDSMGWWGRIGMAFPIVALVIGLLAIGIIQENNSTKELAEVDVALLTDDLPPAAFADPGFVQYLKTTRQSSSVQ